jgi:hypothetical protein
MTTDKFSRNFKTYCIKFEPESSPLALILTTSYSPYGIQMFLIWTAWRRYSQPWAW